MITVGFIGCGRIGSAILKRLASKERNFQLLAHDHSRSKIDHVNRYVERLTEKVREDNDPQPIIFIETIAELIRKSDYVVVALQHHDIHIFQDELAEHLTEGKVIISTMTSVPRRIIRAKTRYIAPVVRIILNTPVAYGKGVVGLCYPKEHRGVEIKNRITYFLSEEQEDFIGQLVKPLGQKLFLDEDKLSIFASVIASGPAYTFFFMEAMLQAALTIGMPYLEAKKCIAICVEGSAYMGSRDAQTFADLRMQASPPGGICMRAINQMELKAVKGEITNAILMANDYCAAQEANHDATMPMKQ